MTDLSQIAQNDRGAVMLIVSLMLIVLLTIIGIGAAKTANTEVKLAVNAHHYQRTFYHAEGAVMEAVHNLANSGNPPGALSQWIGTDHMRINEDTVFAYWREDDATKAVIPQPTVVDKANTSYLAVHHTAGTGNSLDMSKPTKHTFTIYGRCEDRCVVILKVGYAAVYK